MTRNGTEEVDLGEPCSHYDDLADDSDNDYFDPADYVGEYVGFPPSDEEVDINLGTARTKIYDTTQQLIPEDDAAIISRRRQQRRVSEQRAFMRAKFAPRRERLAARTWKPIWVIPVRPVVGMSVNARWKCETLIRAGTAHLAVQKSVNVHQTYIKVQMSCRYKSCDVQLLLLKAMILLNWQRRPGN